MMIRIVATLVACSVTSACGNGQHAPNEATFRRVINAELAKDNPYCLRLAHGSPVGIQGSALADRLGHLGLLEPRGTAWGMNEKNVQILFQGRKRPDLGLWACIADGAEVGEIINWTEPANLFGKTVTEVTYVMKPVKVAMWITPEVAPLIPQLKETQTRTMNFLLTAKGWEHRIP